MGRTHARKARLKSTQLLALHRSRYFPATQLRRPRPHERMSSAIDQSLIVRDSSKHEAKGLSPAVSEWSLKKEKEGEIADIRKKKKKKLDEESLPHAEWDRCIGCDGPSLTVLLRGPSRLHIRV